jgi:glycosyltransferase involved in cell wall biosynthesis
MNILQIYNQQRSQFSGEESVIDTVGSILERHGHKTVKFVRSSRGMENSPFRKMKVGMSGVFNPSAYRSVRTRLQADRPDIVHVHNVYPNFSPSIFAACRREHVPAVFHVHSQILTCPNWNHLRNGKVCELCCGGREYWCIVKNCRGSLAESASYALRSAVARMLKLFANNVTLFVTVSQFLRHRLINAGFPENRIEVLPNTISSVHSGGIGVRIAGSYIGFTGRLSSEKGVCTLIEAARRCELPVRIAGDGPERAVLERNAPRNVEFMGHLAGQELRAFYQNSRFIVMPSRCFEAFGLSAAEAMMYGKPVIASRIGALPELVEDGVTGKLVDVDNVTQLAECMRTLWGRRDLCESYGAAARSWAEAACSQELYYHRLISIYERASRLVAGLQ